MIGQLKGVTNHDNFLFSLNGRSLIANKDEILHFLTTRNSTILCVSEARTTEDIEDWEIGAKGYNLVRCDSDSRFTGGVVVYIKSGVNFKIKEKYAVQRGYWFLLIEVVINKAVVMLGCVYRSPNSPCVQFLDFLEDLLTNVINQHKGDFLITGDFNIDWNSDSCYSKRLKQIINDAGCKQLINEYTRVTDTSNTIVDLVISNNKKLSCYVLNDTIITDHKIINIELGKNMVSKCNSIVIRPKEYDQQLLRQQLTDLVFNFNFREYDIDKKYDEFYVTFMQIIEDRMPKKEIIIRTGKCSRWFNGTILKAIKERDYSYKKFLVSKDMKDWDQYKLLRNKTVQVLKSEKKSYYERTIEDYKYDPKNMWKTLKILITKSESDDFGEIIFENKKTDVKTEIVEEFNNFYIESTNKIVNTIVPVQRVFQFAQCNNGMQDFQLLSIDELGKLIGGMPNKGSPDEIHMALLKENFDVIASVLINLVNTSLEFGVIPNRLKLSTIVPIRKVSNTKKVEEFRPVNMLPAVEKILETVVYIQLLKFIEENKILSKYQSGFREGYSCETAFQFLLNKWKSAIDNDMAVNVVFLDLKRAFETVDRERLLLKLRKYGFRGNVLLWLENYLNDRKQMVKCKEIVSSAKEINLGVPQGSVLGPLLFILYINDVELTLEKCNIHMFADDTIVYIEGRDLRNNVEIINKELNDVNDWLRLNRLKLNANKTKAIIISNEVQYRLFKQTNLKIEIDHQEIEVVDQFKYLGFIVDRQLKFKEHIDYICKKISKKLGILYRCSSFISLKTRLTIYNSIVLPHFIYSASIISMATQGELNRLQVLQNRGMRTILQCNRYAHVDNMLQKLNWIDIRKLVKVQVLTFIHKIRIGLHPDYFAELMMSCDDVHNHQTRNKNNFYLEAKNKKTTQNSIFFKGVREYNKLPNSIKGSITIAKFKKYIIEFLVKDLVE